MARFSGSGAVSGGMSGAATGTMIMPGWGTAIGAGVGLLAGGFMGGEGGGSGLSASAIGDLEHQAYVRRANAIHEFGLQLAQARERYLQRATQLRQSTFQNFFTPDMTSELGAKGFQAGGGAFNSALAREAAKQQAGLFQEQAGMERQDITNLGNMTVGNIPTGQTAINAYMAQADRESAKNASLGESITGGASNLALIAALSRAKGGGPRSAEGGHFIDWNQKYTGNTRMPGSGFGGKTGY